jgi:hypothetical protein
MVLPYARESWSHATAAERVGGRVPRCTIRRHADAPAACDGGIWSVRMGDRYCEVVLMVSALARRESDRAHGGAARVPRWGEPTSGPACNRRLDALVFQHVHGTVQADQARRQQRQANFSGADARSAVVRTRAWSSTRAAHLDCKEDGVKANAGAQTCRPQVAAVPRRLGASKRNAQWEECLVPLRWPRRERLIETHSISLR